MLGADLLAEHVLPVAVPTGVVTGAIGAPYLIWLLATTNRAGRRRMTRERPRAAGGAADARATTARTSIHDLDLLVPTGRITTIVGANACGKSTLLRGLARLLRPRGGAVILDGTSCTT